jgi:hypothetical protein
LKEFDSSKNASICSGLNGSPLLKNKRSKTETQPSVDQIQQYVTIWVCQSRQLDRRTRIELYYEACFTVLLERVCEIYDQSIEKSVLFIQCDDNTWSEISVKNGDPTLRESGIGQHSTISLEEKEPVKTSTDTDVHFTSLYLFSSENQ